MAVILVMTAIGGWAIFTDRISYVVTHGVSMNPLYYQGDLIVVFKDDSYQVGQIAAYHGAGPGLEVLHRIIGGDATTGYIFKGDNNQSIDTIEPTADEVIGRAVLHVPKGGIWLKPLLSPTGLGMLGFLVISSGAGQQTRRDIPRGRRKKRVKAMSGQGSSWATALAVVKAVSRLPPVLRIAAALVALAALAAVVLGVLGWMKPLTESTSVATGAEQSIIFSYSAKVARTPAYDGTTITSPDPVFRTLTNSVDLHMHYEGHPGALSVSATLSDGSGWHSSMELVPAKQFSSRAFDAAVSLDLVAIEERARAAQKAIGIESKPTLVSLKAQVTRAGTAEFSAPLNLSLTPLSLALATGAQLKTDNSASIAKATLVPRTIDVFGHPLMTAASGRYRAMLLLLGVGLGAAAITFVGRRRTPLRARADIERRYPQLLVPVEPMPSPPGKPVVIVDNFPALVRLAERYGQMILTWSRPDAEDFVVRDDGITYRYRIQLETPTLENIERAEPPLTAGSHRKMDTTPLP